MKNIGLGLSFSILAVCVSAILSADDVVLSIGPETYLSSDSVTLCRVYARNQSGHAIDGRGVRFEAQAWENGEIIAREHGQFGGKIEAGATVESRIGFVGVYREFTVTPDVGGHSGGSLRAGTGKSKGTKKPARKTSGGKRKR